MEREWDTLPPQVKRELESSLLSQGSQFSREQLSGFLIGSLGMKYRWDKSRKITDMVFRGINKDLGDRNRIKESQSQSIANIIYSLGEMEWKWEELPSDVRRSLCCGIEYLSGRLNPQEASNIIVG